MTEREATFIADIKADPDRDDPRLIYADWLEENAGTVSCGVCNGKGWQLLPDAWKERHSMTKSKTCDHCDGAGHVPDDRAERAEFIRVQCRLAVIYKELQSEEDCGGPCCEETQTLRVREQELLSKYGKQWRDFGTFVPYGNRVVFRRGFVEELTINFSTPSTYGHIRAVYDRTPLRTCRIVGAIPAIETTVIPTFGLRLSGSHQTWTIADLQKIAADRGEHFDNAREWVLAAEFPGTRFLFVDNWIEEYTQGGEIRIGDRVVTGPDGRFVRAAPDQTPEGIVLSVPDAQGNFVMRQIISGFEFFVQGPQPANPRSPENAERTGPPYGIINMNPVRRGVQPANYPGRGQQPRGPARE